MIMTPHGIGLPLDYVLLLYSGYALKWTDLFDRPQ